MMSLTCALAQDVKYTISHRYLTHTVGNASTEDNETTYLCVPVAAKNLTPKSKTIGGVFGIGNNFKVAQNGFSYDVDAGVGWQSIEAYSGNATLTPLITKKFIVCFTVPSELARGQWTMTLPDKTTVDIKAMMEHY